jgi:hypothetical protein
MSDTTGNCIFCSIRDSTHVYKTSQPSQSEIENLATNPHINGTLVLAETDEFFVVQPLDPAAESHLLVIPKTHIQDINELTSRHIGMIQQMIEIGYHCMLNEDRLANSNQRRIQPNETQSLKQPIEPPTQLNIDDMISFDDIPLDTYARGWYPTNGYRFAFHKPPFNQIGHLHMHILRLPFTTYTGQAQFSVDTWPVSWATDALTLIQTLKQRAAS